MTNTPTKAAPEVTEADRVALYISDASEIWHFLREVWRERYGSLPLKADSAQRLWNEPWVARAAEQLFQINIKETAALAPLNQARREIFNASKKARDALVRECAIYRSPPNEQRSD